MQCGMLIGGTPDTPELAGDGDFSVNRGALCIKGWTSAGALAHPDRLTSPLVRNADGALEPATWDEALDRIAECHPFVAGPLRQGRDWRVRQRRAHQREGVPARQVRARGARHTAHRLQRPLLHGVGGGRRQRGVRTGSRAAVSRSPTSPRPRRILLVGSNVAETLPPVMQYFDAQRRAGGHLIVVDPRRTPTAAAATLHLPLAPGTDGMLANGLLHVLIRDGLVDEAYIAQRTAGFAAVRAAVAACWPGRVERITGVPEADIVRAAHLLGRSRTSMVLTARGAEQQAQGVANTLAFINIALALGQVGRRGGGFGCLTGQGNGQGGREHGQKSDQLPGYRSLRDPQARAHVAAVWGVDPDALPPPGISAFELLDALGTDAGPRGLLVFGSNPAVSAPAAGRIGKRLRALDLLVVCDFFVSETAALADVVLPVAMWAEEEGTITNLEGRVLRRRRVFSPPAGVRTDIDVLHQLASRLGRGEGFAFDSAAAVFEELGRASAGGPADYRGISHARLDAGEALYWPCPDEAHPGTPRLFASEFPTPTGRARFHVVTPTEPAEAPDREYPLYLTTGRVLAQYQSGTQTRRLRELVDRAPVPRVEVHPVTATAARHQRRRHRHRPHATRRGDVAGPRHRERACRHHLRALPLGRPRVGEPADQPCTRSDQPDARVQGVRGPPRTSRPRYARSPTRARQPGRWLRCPRSPRASRHSIMNTQRLVIIGNGMAGARLAEEVVRRDDSRSIDITILGDEPYGNYNRILLSGVLAGSHRAQDVFINPLDWYVEHEVTLHAGAPVTRIDRERQCVYAGGDLALPYDDLVIATGSMPFIPPIEGLRGSDGRLASGVYAFRTLDDCHDIVRHAKRSRRAAVIGGGLLGLEAARGLLELGLEVHVVHLMPHLMEVQLDRAAGRVLERTLREMGVHLHLETATTGVIGDGVVEGLRFADGTSLDCDLVVVSAGIRPNTSLARAGWPRRPPRHRRRRRPGDIRSAHLRHRRMLGTPRPDVWPRRAALGSGPRARRAAQRHQA